MINSNLFRAKMVANGYNQRTLADKLHMSENALSSKIKGKSSFNLKEVQSICELLCIVSDEDKCAIFLP